MNVGSLQWAVGLFCVVIGALMLVAPHQFDAPMYAALQPHLLWLGAILVVAAAALLSVAVFRVSRALVIAAHLLAGATLFLLAGGFTLGVWVWTSHYVVLAVGTALAPLLSHAHRRPSSRQVDLFVLLMGLSGILTGLVLLSSPARFSPSLNAVSSPSFVWLGGALVGGGLFLTLAQLTTTLPRRVDLAAHLLLASAFLAYLIVVPLPRGIWTGIIYYGGFGVLLGLLPWLSTRLGTVDPASLRTRLGLTLAAAAALPLIVATVIHTAVEDRSATAEVFEAQQALVIALADQAAAYAGLHRSAVAAVAAYPGLSGMTPDGQRALLRSLGSAYPEVLAFSTYDAAGHAIARSDDRPPVAAAGLIVFEATRGTNAPSVDVHISPVTGRPLVAFGAPIRGPDGRFEGLVVGVVEPVRVTDLLVRTSTSAGVEAYLVDNRGRVVAHTDAALATSLADFSAIPPVSALLATGYSGSLSFSTAAGAQLASYAPVPGLRLGVIVQRPEVAALARLRSARTLAFETLLLVICSAAVAGAFVAGRLAAPLGALARAVDQFASGKVGTPLPQSDVLEVAQLAAAFGELRERLTARTAEREQAEEALRGSEKRFRAIFDQAAIGIALVDLQGHPVQTNRAVQEMLGYSGDELRSMTFSQFTHEDDVAANVTLFDELVAGKRDYYQMEKCYYRKDGSLVWAHLTASLLRGPQGQPQYGLGVLENITERRLAEDTIRQSKEEAERANRAKNEFLSRMSHELRTPLNAILGFAQLLEMDSPRPEQRESVEHILKAGHHLLELINEVLDISRIDSGRLSLSPAPVPVCCHLAVALDLVRPLAIQRSVRLVDKAAAAVDRHVLADQQRLQQVLLNLLSNAVKYNAEGGTVVLSYEETAEARLRISVGDTGPGIPAEKMARLFMPFDRLGAEHTGVEGTGLGLALSKRLVEAMGGTIGVDSTVGQGSTFWIELPLASGPTSQPERTLDGISTPSEIEAFRQACTVLYIEDDVANLELVAHVLVHLPGAKLLPAMQGGIGLDLARQHHPDLILLDLYLPDIPGVEVLRRLQDDPRTRRIPTIVISADATPSQIERLLAAGARAYLTKPLDVRRFLGLVDEILKEGSS